MMFRSLIAGAVAAAALLSCGGKDDVGVDASVDGSPTDASSDWDARAHLNECCNADAGPGPWTSSPVTAPDTGVFPCPHDDNWCSPDAICGFNRQTYDQTDVVTYGCCTWTFGAPQPAPDCNPPP